MWLVWAIKDYLCLQGPDMFMANHAGRAAAEHRMVGNWRTVYLTHTRCLAPNLTPTHPYLVGIRTCLWEPKSPPSVSFHHPCLVLQDSLSGGGCHYECSQGGFLRSEECGRAA